MMKKLFTLLLFGFISWTQNISLSQDHVKGEVLIQINPNFSSEYLIRMLETDLNSPISEITCLSQIMNIYLVKFEDSDINLDKVISYGNSHVGFSHIQKNHLIQERETIPSDTLFTDLWHLKNTGQTGGVVDADIDATDAWDITTGGLTTHGDTIVVCAIESSGVDLNHVDLKNNIWKNYGEIPNDGIDNDNNGYIDDYLGWHVINEDDVIGAGPHGTRVAGMIGATGNNITGVVGVNWNVKIMVVQGQDVTNEASVIAAYNYPLTMRKLYNESQGTQGAFVVATNSSWGINGGDPANSPLWCAMYDSLGHYGILNIAATTNNNANVDLVGDLPTTCPSDFLVAVTMTNSQDIRASSGYGTTHVDIGAPGNLVKTTSPGNSYSTVSGTSFATPNVVGCVALAYSSPCAEFINYAKFNPEGAAAEMRYYLLESVEQNPSLITEVSSGGRVNVKNLIDSLINSCAGNSCISPYYLNANVLSDSSVTITWSGFSSDYIVWFQPSGMSPIPINLSGTTTLTIDTLSPCSYYTFQIQSNCGTDSSILSFPITFQTDGCCNNPALILDSKTNNDITISWADILNATAYDIRYKKSTAAVWNELLDISSPYNFTSLDACSDYEFQIKTQCADSTHGYSNSFVFTTNGCGACTEQIYCSVYGAKTNYEYINSISINGFSNVTGNNGGWYTSNQIITALTPGSVYNISLTPGYASSIFTEGFSIWIDFNYNGVFEVSENLLNNVTTNSILNTIITIPLSATPGITKMRIGMSALDPPEICPIASFWGEYEDYCVYIGPQVGLSESKNSMLSIYPNPTTGNIYIQSNENLLGVNIYTPTGQLVLSSTTILNQQVDVSNLPAGTYFIFVETETGNYKTQFIKL